MSQNFITLQHVIEIFNTLSSKRVIPSGTVGLIKRELNSVKIGTASKETIVAIIESASSTNEEWVNELFSVIEKVKEEKLLSIQL